MKPESIDIIRAKIPKVLEQVPYLKALILFGSRARGDYEASSDWDFGVIFDENNRQKYEPSNGWNSYHSWVVLEEILNLQDLGIDWVDLNEASDLLAHSIAKDGIVIYERDPGLFKSFKEKHLLKPYQLKEINLQHKSQINAALKEWGL